VILLDDGSDDGFTPKKLAAIEYDKITEKHLFTENVGTAKRYNSFIKNAENKYVVILCGDDILEPTFLEECVNFLEAHPNHAAVATDYDHFGEEDIGYQGVLKISEEKISLINFLLDYAAQYLGSCLMRKEALDQFTLPELERKSDLNRWIYFLENGWELGVINKMLFNYRKLSNSQMFTTTIDIELNVKAQTYDLHEDSFRKYAKEIFLDQYKQIRHLQGEVAEREAKIQRIINSRRYKIGLTFSAPYRFLRRLFSK